MPPSSKKFSPSQDTKFLGIVIERAEKYYIQSVSKKRKDHFEIAENSIDAKIGDLVYVELSKQRKQKFKKPAVILSTLVRKASPKKLLSDIALEEHDVRIGFSQDILDEVKASPPIQVQKREDWTHFPFVTIDPETAKDHDDALYAEYDQNPNNLGGFIVYVAIADVAHYVKLDSLTDKEASTRGNSIYLPDRVIPMLPETLSNDLCSLKANKIRPVMGVKIIYDSYGQKLSHQFYRAQIHCKANLSYEEAMHVYDGLQDERLSPYKDTLFPLFQAFKAVNTANKKHPPLHLNLIEYEILLNTHSEVTSIHPKHPLATHKVIETFMVAANICAAETLEEVKHPFLYRVHEAPSADKLAILKNTLKDMNIGFAKGQTVTPVMFNQILKKARGTAHEELVNKLVLRCQCQATYTPKNGGHYGLNLVRYTHFTSPIRRYADLLVHRALLQALSLEKETPSEKEQDLASIGNHISGTERKAMKIEMETKDRYFAHYMEKFIGNIFDVIISGLCSAGVFVRIPEYGAEGFIPMKDLTVYKRRFFTYNEETNKIIDERSGDYYILGQRLHVKLCEAVPITGGMRFILIDEKFIHKKARKHQNAQKKSQQKIQISRKKHVKIQSKSHR